MNSTPNNSVYEFSFTWNGHIFNALFHEDETNEGNVYVIHHITTTADIEDIVPVSLQILSRKIKDDLSNDIFFPNYPDHFFGKVCLGIFNRLKNLKKI